MKRIILVTLCAVFAFSTTFAQSVKKNEKETITFTVKNMSCDNCVKKIEKNIAFEKGVTDLQCQLASKTVKVTYRTDKTTEKQIVAAFKKLGYEVETKAAAPKP
jgi:Cu2+-exporting ATPase